MVEVPHETDMSVVLLVLIVIGAQPVVEFKVNCGDKGADTQIVLVSVSVPHLFAVLIDTVYVPATKKLILTVGDPACQRPGSAKPKSLPNIPELKVNPVLGETDQTLLGPEQDPSRT